MRLVASIKILERVVAISHGIVRPIPISCLAYHSPSLNNMTEFEALERALSLAQNYVGMTSPNPPVGAVCLRHGDILGEGAHQRAGTPHAEVHALQSCTEDPAGATLCVTLEPCSTTGRTPPCCDLIIAKKIKRVVIGCLDPNPKHAGRGVDILRAQGIEVIVADGDLQKRCQALIAPFVKVITQGRAFIRLKLAMTLDGAIADATSSSRWITGAKARQWVQEMRAHVDAIMVGSGTVREDHPSLQPHLPNAPLKKRILVDRSTPIDANDIDEMTLVASKDLAYDGEHLDVLLQSLCQHGINDVLCEGGGHLAGALLEQGCVDEIYLFYAPKLLGDPKACKGFVLTPKRLHEAYQFETVGVQQLGEDVLLHLRPKK